jgi:4'-phosphopantetheinyl transferase
MFAVGRSIISPDEAWVFLLNSDALDAVGVDQAWSVLSAEEQGRALRFQRMRDRTAFVASHALLRTALARQTGLEPAALRFQRSRQGRPELDLDDPSGRLRFSLSHTDGLVGCAISRVAEIGFDLEIARYPAPLDVADRYFADAERDWLSALPLEARHDQFYALWTIKEAYVKALGTGLDQPLNTFCIELSPGGAARFGRSPAIAAEAETWTLRSWRQGGHWAGLAVKAAVGDVRICRHDLMETE